uniref:Uncharacterized protein n=1 Tax=viral metagenome TaxID=1070528 RepID=A0A6C0B4L8_9ZZZZ
MWKSVQSSITSAGDDPVGAGNAILDKALGPSFDYLQTIQSPHDKHVGSEGTMDQVGTNANAIFSYVDNLIVGPKVGNQFFKDTGGMCRLPGTKDKDGNDNGDGEVVPRFSYTNNKLGGDDAAAILGASFQKAVAGNGFDGIIPGAGGDLAAMNPLKIMNGLVLDGVPPCKAWTCPTTDIRSGVDQGPQTKFLATSLEFNMSPCRAATASETANLMAMINADKKAAEKVAKDAEDAAAAKTKSETAAKAKKDAKGLNPGEKYANFQDNLYQAPVQIDYIDSGSAATLAVAFVIFIGYVLLKND